MWRSSMEYASNSTSLKLNAWLALFRPIERDQQSRPRGATLAATGASASPPSPGAGSQAGQSYSSERDAGGLRDWT